MGTQSGSATARPAPERVPWAELGPEFIRAWGFPDGKFQPEHVEILGPTGSGKSFAEKVILLERARLRGSHVVVIATKPADETVSSMGWPIVEQWPPTRGWRQEDGAKQVIYWAKADGLSKAAREGQAAQVADLLHKLWKPNSNIIVVFDEIAYVEKELGLATTVATYYREARALGITIVANTQRPQGVSRFVHSESTWVFAFAPKDEEDAERIAQVLGNKKYYKEILGTLDRSKREFLLVHNRTNAAYISYIDTPAIEVKKSTLSGAEPTKPGVRDKAE